MSIEALLPAPGQPVWPPQHPLGQPLFSVVTDLNSCLPEMVAGHSQTSDNHAVDLNDPLSSPIRSWLAIFDAWGVTENLLGPNSPLLQYRETYYPVQSVLESQLGGFPEIITDVEAFNISDMIRAESQNWLALAQYTQAPDAVLALVADLADQREDAPLSTLIAVLDWFDSAQLFSSAIQISLDKYMDLSFLMED